MFYVDTNNALQFFSFVSSWDKAKETSRGNLNRSYMVLSSRAFLNIQSDGEIPH